MTKQALIGLALLLCSVGHALADDAPLRPPLKFDEVNPPLERVLARATAQQKPIFIEFFLDG